MSELLPCPFCGGTNIELRDNGIGDVYAICYSNEPDEEACGARTCDANCETDAGAIRRWNRRAAPASLAIGQSHRLEELPPSPLGREEEMDSANASRAAMGPLPHVAGEAEPTGRVKP